MEQKLYTVAELQEILQISRTKTYAYIKNVYTEGKPFRVLKIGDNYRISKASFDRWLDGDFTNIPQ